MTSHDTVPVDYYLLQREATHESINNMSGLQHPMATGTLSHMPTEQYMPTGRLTSSFQLNNGHPLAASGRSGNMVHGRKYQIGGGNDIS